LESDAVVVAVVVVARPLSGPDRPPLLLLLLLAVIPSGEEGEGDEGVGVVVIDAHRCVAQ
jgi:hypothetical protein